MASQISRDRVRLALTDSGVPVVDVLTSAQAAAFVGNDLQVEVANLTGNALVDISNVSMLEMDLKPLNSRDALPLASKVLASGALNVSLLLADWQSNDPTKAHATFVFTGSDTNITLDDVQQDFFFTIYAYTTDTPARKVTWGTGLLTLIDDGSQTPPPVFVQSPTYITLAQAVAMFTIDGTKVNKSGDVMSGLLTFSGTGNAGIKLSNLTTAQKLALTPAAGMYVFDTNLLAPSWYNGSAWKVPVLSVNNLTGAVALTTTNIPEGLLGLYFTENRVLTTPLTGLTIEAGAVTAADTVLTAIGKLAAGGTPGSGLTSVGLTMPTGFLVANTPLIANGTLAVTLSVQAPNTGFFGPTSGANATPTWRGIVVADLPSIPESQVSNLTADLAARLQLAGGIMTGQITLPSGVQTGLQATSRTTTDALYAALTGATFTGAVNTLDLTVNAANSPTWAGTPTTANHLVNKTYADTKLALGGGTLTGDLLFSGTGHGGLVANNLADSDRSALGAPVKGTLIYNTTNSQLQFYNGNWITVGTVGAGTGALLNAAGAPSNGNGNNGDYYFNTTTGDIYLKAGGVWSIIVVHGVKSSGDTMTGPLSFSGTGHAGLILNNIPSASVGGLPTTAGSLIYNSDIQRIEMYSPGGGWQVLGVSGTSFPAQVATLTTAPTNALISPAVALAVTNTGPYRVSIYIAVTTAAAGSVQSTISWTDADGNAQTFVSASLNTAALTNYLSFTIPLRAAASTNITYQTSYSGTGFYRHYAEVERLA